ncbi:hypothetical protein Dimus_004013 [Dionaea muscipula]
MTAQSKLFRFKSQKPGFSTWSSVKWTSWVNHDSIQNQKLRVDAYDLGDEEIFPKADPYKEMMGDTESGIQRCKKLLLFAVDQRRKKKEEWLIINRNHIQIRCSSYIFLSSFSFWMFHSPFTYNFSKEIIFLGGDNDNDHPRPERE